MKIKSCIGPIVLLALGVFCVAWVWVTLLHALVTPEFVFYHLPRYIVVFAFLLLVAEGLTVIHCPKAFLIPFVLLAFAVITLLSCEPLHWSTSLSWDGYKGGWPMSWLDLTVRRHAGTEITKTLEHSFSVFSMITDLGVTALLAAPLLLGTRMVKRRSEP